MNKLSILTLGIIFTLLSCSSENELRTRLEKQLPRNASPKVKSIYNRYVNDCVEMYSYFKNVKKSPEEYDYAMQNFKKKSPNNYMLKSGFEVCKENNVTDSLERKTIEGLVKKMMGEYFAYTQK